MLDKVVFCAFVALVQKADFFLFLVGRVGCGQGVRPRYVVNEVFVGKEYFSYQFF